MRSHPSGSVILGLGFTCDVAIREIAARGRTAGRSLSLSSRSGKGSGDAYLVACPHASVSERAGWGLDGHVVLRG